MHIELKQVFDMALGRGHTCRHQVVAQAQQAESDDEEDDVIIGKMSQIPVPGKKPQKHTHVMG